MAKSKDDIKYATSQARHSEDEAVRVAYKHGTPLEAGKIADSEAIDVFSSARNVSKAQKQGSEFSNSDQQSQLQQRKDAADNTKGGETEASSTVDFSTGAPRFPKKGASSAGYEY
ncbi:SEED MATURATION PROTEIN 1 [Prosopis cineraria]|uniref:SEED MATURATION PROTEIN 1 n=1 Tax=Prosopis cineraria TaxID=364024 RepID=UPI00240EF357|nr:SEED MATURATION PROTEIN 1 [Prosopis cineraria]